MTIAEEARRITTLGSLAVVAAIGITSLAHGQTTQSSVGPPPTTRPDDRPPGQDAFSRSTTETDALKKELKATDEEWRVIGPQLRKVIAARQATLSGLDQSATTGSGGRGMNRRDFGGRFGPSEGSDFGGNSSFIAPGGAFGPPGGGPPGRGRPQDRGGPPGFGPPDGDPNFRPTSGPAGEGIAAPIARSGGAADTGSPDDGPHATSPQSPRPASGGDTKPAPANQPIGSGEPPPGAPGLGPPGFGGRSSALQQAIESLQRQLQDPTFSPEKIQSLVAAVRAARQHATDQLASNQKALSDLLTLEQQAVLISRGYLN